MRLPLHRTSTLGGSSRPVLRWQCLRPFSSTVQLDTLLSGTPTEAYTPAADDPVPSLKGSTELCPHFEERFYRLASKTMTPVSLSDLFRVGQEPTQAQSLLNAQFLRRELSIRFAQRAMQLLHLPCGLSEHPSVQEAADIYRQITALLLISPHPRSAAEEEDFARILRATKLSAQSIPGKIGVALTDIRRRRIPPPREQRLIDQQLDLFFSSRIGHRFLIEHYLASKEPRDGFSGIIQSNCSPVAVCEDAALSTVRRTAKRFGVTPYVSVIGDRDMSFTYLPCHVYFIVAELLKNVRGGGAGVPRGYRPCARGLTRQPPRPLGFRLCTQRCATTGPTRRKPPCRPCASSSRGARRM